jgi:hypothetical protein
MTYLYERYNEIRTVRADMLDLRCRLRSRGQEFNSTTVHIERLTRQSPFILVAALHRLIDNLESIIRENNIRQVDEFHLESRISPMYAYEPIYQEYDMRDIRSEEMYHNIQRMMAPKLYKKELI